MTRNEKIARAEELILRLEPSSIVLFLSFLRSRTLIAAREETQGTKAPE
jgi:hypothetical protein